jgi:bifunctional DNA-binding transcriptional regulator/antitoxin component of YhaV-PrlF toxin-antitoxin module
MSSQSAQVHVSQSGRLSIPVAMRRQLGLEKGGVVSLHLDDDGLRIETMQQIMQRIQALARAGGWTDKVSVDDFIAWKREEARREYDEMDAK